MKKFGLIWLDGRGERSPANQREQLMEYGVPEQNIVTSEADLPAGRTGDVVTVGYLAPLADDPQGEKAPYPHFLARRFGAITDGGRALHVRETGKTYEGLDGLIALICDWVAIMRRGQTERARATSGGRPKLRAPAFYLRLSQADKIAVRKAFETPSPDRSVPQIAQRFGTKTATLYRCARMLEWSNPGEFRQKK